MPDVYWDQWDFEEFEIDLLDYARKNNLDYNPKHPLSLLPDDAAKRALNLVKGSYREIAKFMPADEKTVSGWFRPGRNPGRTTVSVNILPALCELFIRHDADPSLLYHFEHLAYIYDGKRPSKDYVRMVQNHVFILLTTGKMALREDRSSFLAQNVEIYNREVLRYAACFLSRIELEALAHAALNALISHVNNPSANKDYPDAVTKEYNANTWYFYAGAQPNKKLFPAKLTLETGDAIDPMPENYPLFAAGQLGASEILHRVENMSDGDLETLIQLIKQEQRRRAKDFDVYMEQMRELDWEREDQDEDEGIWYHWAG